VGLEEITLNVSGEEESFYKTPSGGLFKRAIDEEGNATIGDWVGYLNDDLRTIRYTNAPNNSQRSEA
jgi:hypothetical protein